MIKLELLLRKAGAEPGLDPALRALLEAQGLSVSGAGRATVSASIAEADFVRLFGAAPAIRAGYAAGPLSAPGLPVPAALADAISLITVACPAARRGPARNATNVTN